MLRSIYTTNCQIMQRSRLETENRLIEAVGQLVKESGFDHLGINRVASQAGVNKILIYRYFGGLGGLLSAYFEQTRPVSSVPPIDINQLKNASLEVFFTTCYNYLIEEFRLLRHDIEAQELLKAKLLSNDGIVHAITAEKERRLVKMVDDLSAIVHSSHARPFAAILVSSLTLLLFTGQQKRQIMGIDPSTDEGWAEIEQALKNIFQGIYLFTKERLAASAEKSA